MDPNLLAEFRYAFGTSLVEFVTTSSTTKSLKLQTLFVAYFFKKVTFIYLEQQPSTCFTKGQREKGLADKIMRD